MPTAGRPTVACEPATVSPDIEANGIPVAATAYGSGRKNHRHPERPISACRVEHDSRVGAMQLGFQVAQVVVGWHLGRQRCQQHGLRCRVRLQVPLHQVVAHGVAIHQRGLEGLRAVGHHNIRAARQVLGGSERELLTSLQRMQQ